MRPLVALCADETSLRHPETMGLDGESLASQGWLRLFSSGAEARRFLKEDRRVDEAWVVSCDDIEPINLAATLKSDRRSLKVCLVSFQGTGSLFSRAMAAGIDATLTRQAFAMRYAAFKRVRAEAPHRETPGVEGPRAEAPRVGAPGIEGPGAAKPRAEASGTAKRRGETSDAGERASAGMRDLPEPVPFQPEEPAGIVQAMAGGPVVQAPQAGILLPIVSGSGGSGKSTVATLAAILSQRRGKKTLLLDFDLQFGDLREMMGLPDALGIDEVLETPALLAKLEPSGPLPALLGAPRHLEEAEAVIMRAPALLESLRARFDVVVANTGAAWAEQHALLLERCTKALFLIDQRASSLRGCRHALDLCARCGIAASPFLFAVNFCSKGAPLSSIDVSCALRGAETLELADGGVEVDGALTEGRPLDLVEGRNPLCRSIDAFLEGLLPSTEGAFEQAGGSLAALKGLFGRRRRKRGAA